MNASSFSIILNGAALVAFLLAAFGVTIGSVGLIPLGLACMAGSCLVNKLNGK